MEDHVPQIAGVVDQAIDAAKLGHRFFDHFVGIFPRRHAFDQRDRAPAHRFDFFDDFLRRTGIVAAAIQTDAEIIDRDRGPGFGGFKRDGTADPASGAGDEDDFILQ